jgi:hypothetical protein
MSAGWFAPRAIPVQSNFNPFNKGVDMNETTRQAIDRQEVAYEAELRVREGKGVPLNCKHCRNGFRGSDVECVNGVLIDIDEYTEGWPRDHSYPPAPCHVDYCSSCCGTGEDDGGDCAKCDGSGYMGGRNDCQKRLLFHSGLDK